MARTKSDDSPVITVKVEQGRLVPVSAYDMELITRWRDGAVLNVDPVLVFVRPLEKKYFAMLSTLIKEADTPWTNTDTAHEALKLAAGFITPLKKKNGQWGSRSRHISSFSDLELSEYFEVFCGIVRKRFGIDPDELQRSSPDIGESSGTPPTEEAADDAPGAGPIPVGVGEPDLHEQHQLHEMQERIDAGLEADEGYSETPSVEASTDGAPEAGDTIGAIPREVSSADGLHPEELAWLKTVARMLVAATEPGGEVDIVDRQVAAIKKNLTPPEIGRAAKDIAQLIYRHCRAVTNGERPLDAKWVAYTAHCNPTDLNPKAR